MLSQSILLIAPNITVIISPLIETLSLVSTTFALKCEINGISDLDDPIVMYQWTNMRTNDVITEQMLSFSSLSLSNAGVYECEVKINTSFLHDVINKSHTYDLIINGK